MAGIVLISRLNHSDPKRREPKGEADSDESSEEEESEEESEKESTKPALAIENPNLVKKGPIKASAVKGPPQELTRRERYDYTPIWAYY